MCDPMSHALLEAMIKKGRWIFDFQSTALSQRIVRLLNFVLVLKHLNSTFTALRPFVLEQSWKKHSLHCDIVDDWNTSPTEFAFSWLTAFLITSTVWLIDERSLFRNSFETLHLSKCFQTFLSVNNWRHREHCWFHQTVPIIVEGTLFRTPVIVLSKHTADCPIKRTFLRVFSFLQSTLQTRCGRCSFRGATILIFLAKFLFATCQDQKKSYQESYWETYREL